MPSTNGKSVLQQTRGNKVNIQFGRGKKATFTAGGRKRYMLEKEYDSASYGPVGFVYVNGTLRLADGTKVFAVLGISEADGGEHSGTGVFAPSGEFVWQEDADFCKALGKTKVEVFPYNYRYDGQVRGPDHHVGDDGWSR